MQFTHTFTLGVTLAASAVFLSSCALNDEENYDTNAGYDTSDPYGVPNQGGYESAPYQQVNPPADNPTYSPAAYESTTPAPSNPGPPPAVAGNHTVVKGDTLWGLSRKYGVSQDAIRAVNNMPAGSTNIQLGQTLNIPAP